MCDYTSLIWIKTQTSKCRYHMLKQVAITYFRKPRHLCFAKSGAFHAYFYRLNICVWNMASSDITTRLISKKKIFVNLFRNYVKFFPRIHDLNLVTVCLTALQLLPPTFPVTFHISNLKCLLRFSYRLLFTCIWDPSSPCVSYSFY